MAVNKAILGMILGIVLGGVLGAYLWLSYGDIMFWIVFMGVGGSIGLILGYGQQDMEASRTES